MSLYCPNTFWGHLFMHKYHLQNRTKCIKSINEFTNGNCYIKPVWIAINMSGNLTTELHCEFICYFAAWYRSNGTHLYRAFLKHTWNKVSWKQIWTTNLNPYFMHESPIKLSGSRSEVVFECFSPAAWDWEIELNQIQSNREPHTSKRRAMQQAQAEPLQS